MKSKNGDVVSTESLFLVKIQQLEQKIELLEAEVRDRRQTEIELQLLLKKLSVENNDLEIILDTTTSHSDSIEAILYNQTVSLSREASIDVLTQIANRRAFDQRLEKEWYRLAREQFPLSLLLCDVDFFKRYNDRYGHLAGDACLRTVAKSIESCIRRPADLVARYGGEEFAVILPNTLQEGATFMANKICQAVSDLQIPHEASFMNTHVTISIGISTTFPDQNVSLKTIIESADKALYSAKDQGRDRAVFSC
jgi:diguanylate cyclase (GGDEF)-like protein